MIGGIDIGGTKTIVAIADDNKEILCKEQFLTPKDTPDNFLRECAKRLSLCAVQVGVKFTDLRGIGLSLPGMVDDKEILLHAPFLGWRNVPATMIIRNLTGVQNVQCDCDVNACALAEAQQSGKKQFLWMTVSTGIGGAFVFDGKLYRGSHSLAGEIGHMKVEYEHPYPCTCGRSGCVEAHASGSAMTRLVVELCSKDSSYNQIYEIRNLPRTAAGCSALAEEGEERSLEICRIIGDYLGRAIANAVNLTDPGMVFIGGGMSKSFHLFIEHIRRRMENDCISHLNDTVVFTTELGYEAALMGALSLV